MTTYLINHLRIPNGVPKADNLTYLELVEATFLPFGGKWLAIDAPVEVVEGAWPGAAVLMEFPDRGTAKRWYDSAEYQAVLHLRTDNVISDLVWVEGVQPGFTTTAWAGQIRTALGQAAPAAA
jgi:uncharacterized protein (DUF1330 family)